MRLTFNLLSDISGFVCNTIGAASSPASNPGCGLEVFFRVKLPKCPPVVRLEGGFLWDRRQHLGIFVAQKSKTHRRFIMEKKKNNDEVLDIAREHLGAIDLLCRLLFLAAATDGLTMDRHAIGHLAGFLLHFRNRHCEILSAQGV